MQISMNKKPILQMKYWFKIDLKTEIILDHRMMQNTRQD